MTNLIPVKTYLENKMEKYTNQLSAQQLIQFIANDRPELSHEKVLLQRDGYIKACRAWLEHHFEEEESDS
jgi:hypothetical protein